MLKADIRSEFTAKGQVTVPKEAENRKSERTESPADGAALPVSSPNNQKKVKSKREDAAIQIHFSFYIFLFQNLQSDGV